MPPQGIGGHDGAIGHLHGEERKAVAHCNARALPFGGILFGDAGTAKGEHKQDKKREKRFLHRLWVLGCYNVRGNELP